jgi:cation/acetate symporter
VNDTIGQQSNAFAMFFFFIFIAISLGVTYWAMRRTKSTDAFFAAGREVSTLQNCLAIVGDFIAAAGFLGIGGLVSLVGFDGLIYAMGGAMAWPITMFLLAEPLRNLGKYTLADVLSYRLNSTSIRITSAIGSLGVTFTYLIMQMVGAGSLVSLLFGLPYELAVSITGVFMLIYVLFGGMIATTWVQIIKAVLMLAVVATLFLLVLGHFDFNPIAVFKAAADRNGPQVLVPGGMWSNSIESLSLAMGLVFGVASLPHMLMRFFTVPDARTARRSLLYATGIICLFELSLFVIGFGAMALVGSQAIRAVDRGGNMAIPLLAQMLGGSIFLSFVAAVAFATILAVVSGLTITGVATLTHDIWFNVMGRARGTPKDELKAAKVMTVLICVIGVVLGMIFKGQNIAFLAGLSATIAASTNFPALVLGIFWRGLTSAGAHAGMAAGFIATLGLIYMSPLIQIDILHNAAPLIGLRNPGIISIPLAFAVSILVSLVTRSAQAGEAQMELDMLVGRSDV